MNLLKLRVSRAPAYKKTRFNAGHAVLAGCHALTVFGKACLLSAFKRPGALLTPDVFIGCEQGLVVKEPA